MNDFQKFKFSQEIINEINKRGYEQPTSIQNKAIPHILNRENAIITSSTGSGKTLCFAGPIITHTQPGYGVQSLIIAPTKSLVLQLEKEFLELKGNKPLNILASYGNASYKKHLEESYLADIIIGTTGRISDLVENGAFELGRIKTFVLDEVDEMLHKQYLREIELIMSQIPKISQKLVFSATISKDANKIIREYIKNPKKITSQNYISPKKLKQEVYRVENSQKLSLIVHILETRKIGLLILFVNRQDNVDWLAKNLEKLTTYKVRQLHGDTTPGKRKKVINEFDEQKFDILVTTDIAARGLDISGVTHIINYNVPKDPNKYIHRIGRTARAGENGIIINLVGQKEEEPFLDILKEHKINPIIKNLPQFRGLEPVKKYIEKKPRR